MAFGYQKPVCTGGPWGPGAFNVFTPAMEFFRAHNDRYYTETDTVTDVAVLLNWPSMAYSVSATWIPATLMEQILIQHKVPFDLLFDEQLESINRYRAVILAGQECISEAQAALLTRYVQQGGTLIISGRAGKYNEWREERTASPLPQPGRIGKGQIVVIPEIVRGDLHAARSTATIENPEPGITLKKGAQLSPSQWVLPKNHAEIYQSIVAAMPAGFSIRTEAPLTTVMELCVRAKTKETIAHFINFERGKRTAPFAVTLRKQFPGATSSVACFTADQNEPAGLHFEESSDTVTFIVPPLRVYAMVVVTSAD
jgi:hypothetical protein